MRLFHPKLWLGLGAVAVLSSAGLAMTAGTASANEITIHPILGPINIAVGIGDSPLTPDVPVLVAGPPIWFGIGFGT